MERTYVGLDVHARSVVACMIDNEVGEIRTLRLSPKTGRGCAAADALSEERHSPGRIVLIT